MATSEAEQHERELKSGGPLTKLKVYVKSLGPGLIAGASDDDPSGIGTYAQTGAQFGYRQLWTALFAVPLTIVIQEMCARIALHTGVGLAGILRKHYPRPVLYSCVALLFIANTINLGADLGAMAAAGRLIVGLPFPVWLVAMAVLAAGLQVFVTYRRYSHLLRILSISLFTYIVVAFIAHVDWIAALRGTVIPTLQFDRDYLLNLVAILGTTISPYMFFWQAGQEIEEEIDQGMTTEAQRRGTSRAQLKWMRTDVATGMVFSNVVMWFIIVTTAATLGQHGVTHIDSAEKAAEALKPLAGQLAEFVFAAGILGTGLLALPVLAGSAGYAISETLQVPGSLALKWYQAPVFYGVIVLATVAGAAMNLLGINPMQALYYSAIINGLVAPPLLFMLMLIGGNRRIMQNRANKLPSTLIGWLTTIIMTVSAIALILSFGSGR
jgi:NRAMP (natural resistance-associated macrophage protein)-like metal ion transporter